MKFPNITKKEKIETNMEEKTTKELLEFLAKDEEEAIKGYDDVIAQLGEDHPLTPQLKKIREEEVAHLEFAKEAQENPNLKYVDPSDSNKEEDKDYEDKIKKTMGVKEE